MASDLFTPREKAAILWAEHVTLNTARSRDDVFEEVRKHFSEAEIVELTMVSGLFNLFNRFMDSLGIPLEEQREVDKIKKSLHLGRREGQDLLQDDSRPLAGRIPRTRRTGSEQERLNNPTE